MPSTPAGPSRASPLARRLAEERGIDISLVPGTGPGGRVVKDDVIAFADAAAVEAPAMDEDADEIEAAVGGVEEPVAEFEEPEEETAVGEVEEPVAEVEEPEEAADEEVEEPVAEVGEPEEAADEEIEEPAAEVEEPDLEPAVPEPDLEPFVIEEVDDAAPEIAVQEEPRETESFMPEPDLEPAMQAEAPAVVEDAVGTSEVVPLSRMRQQIARVTVRSKQEQPHFYITSDIDMTEAMSLRRQINESLESQGVRISVNDMIVTACVGAIKKVSEVQLVLHR